ncbi:hypothetical protein A0127_02175 [Thermococcus peptonophilus]|uniref:S-layer protein C-terminal domain-containing protein n=2 Tax=Thermococcus peptonophilus TaxID=53952 RepID=A0A142CTG0_9EURY|nr:hypothetical protein A0127_02175 [Thermococcus peptonophilus]
MRRLALLLALLLTGAIAASAENVSAFEGQPLVRFQVVSQQTWTKVIPIGSISVQIHWTGEFYYSSEEWSALFSVYFEDTGNTYDVFATERGYVDGDGKYIWVLKDIQTTETIESNELAPQERWYGLVVKSIDASAGKITVYSEYSGDTYVLRVGDKIDISGAFSGGGISEKTVLELSSIKATADGAKALLVIHHTTATSAVVELYPNSGYPPGTEVGSESALAPLKPNVPPAVVVVGENAAGADVAAGAKVGIAVQKWIDIVMEKDGGIPSPEFRSLSDLISKSVLAPVQNLNADAMLDTEVSDPDNIAPVVYTVGGPAANQYTKLILEKNEDRLPVKFVKENGKWYLVSKSGDRWSGSYGVILIIPAADSVVELQKRLTEGQVKVADVVVAGLDRKGTYAACNLLQRGFIAPILSGDSISELEYFIEFQSRMLLLFGDDPVQAFTTAAGPSSGFKLQVTAVVVTEYGKIVKVIYG